LKARRIINKIFNFEKCSCDIVTLFFCNDETIIKYNRTYLKHNYATDIITFRYNDEDNEAEMIISEDTVLRNSKRFRTDYLEEMYRVVIHGSLHICGYDDKTKNEKKLIRNKENFYIKYLFNVLQ